MAVTAETLQQIADNRREIGQLSDEQVRALVSQWTAAWDELKPEYQASITELLADAQDGYVSAAKIRANSRLKQALEVTRAQLDGLADAANLTISAAIPEAVDLGGIGGVSLMGTQLPDFATTGLVNTLTTWDMVDAESIAAIVERTTGRIEASTKPLPADIARLMKRELIRGVSVGDNPRTTARRIISRTEGNFYGGLTRAMTISRTEMLDASREGARTASVANEDILEAWRWSADFSARTCPACLSKNGTRFPVTAPGPEGHPNCRCARVPVTKTWRELGFDIDEPADVFPDAEQWYDNLTDDTKARIMGRERMDLLNSGSIGFDDLSTLKHNDDWRDSWQVTSIKKLRAKVA